MYIFTYYFILVLAFNYEALAQTDIETENITEANVSTSTPYISTSTIKPTPNISCETHDNDCNGCVAFSTCYYCGTTNKCHYHWEKIITDKECDMTQAYFLTCKANFKIMMIIIGVLSAIPVLIILIICCYCCCKKKGIKISKDDIKWARKREERQQIAAERRKERAERTEEIRKKYGLVKDSNPYQRFDA